MDYKYKLILLDEDDNQVGHGHGTVNELIKMHDNLGLDVLHVMLIELVRMADEK